MRAEKKAKVAGLLHLANHARHALARGRIETICRLVEDDELRAVDDGLRELGQLLHAERVSTKLAVTGLAQADIEENLMGALQGRFGGKSGELAHHTNERDRGHIGDEGIVFRHEADEGT